MTGSVAPPRSVLTLRRLGLAVAWLALGIFYVTPVSRVAEPDLDSSIHASYAYFTAHHFQYGPQVNTTAGPYGFVMFGYDYGGELFWTRLALTVFFAFGLATLTLWFFCAARGGFWRWLWLLAMLLDLSASDTLFTVAMMMCGLFLVANYERPRRSWHCAAVAAFGAFLALMKATQLAEGFGVFLCILLLALRARSWRPGLRITGAYFAALLLWWVAAGQNPLNLPAYANALRHIAEGYNEAMAIETPPAALVVALILLAAFALLYGLSAWRHRRHPAMLAGCALFAGFTFLAWKHGFVRSDGHMVIFFDFACIAAFALPTLRRILGGAGGSVPARLGTGLLTIAIPVLGLYGSYALYPLRFWGLTSRLPSQWVENFRYVTNPAAIKNRAEFELARLQRKYALPAVRKTVGTRSIDLFGHQMGLLFLNDLNYRPPPMCCGTYHVYNEHFKELNRDHFANPRTRPDFILLKIQSIDFRFAPMDDSLSLLAIIDLYRPVLAQEDAVLLETNPGAGSIVTPEKIGTRRIRFGEDIEVPTAPPGQLLLFSVNLPPNLKGSLRALLYKPPLVAVDFEGEGLEHRTDQRIIPSSLAVPTLLNPTLEHTADFVNLLAETNLKRVTRLRLHTPQPGYFDGDAMTVTFYTRPKPPSITTNELRKIYLHAVYQDLPDLVTPDTSTVNVYKGARVQYMHAPTAVTFNLKGHERSVTMVVGIDENAYLQGRTDGVDFYIELEQPGQPAQILARLWLNPMHVPADRGAHRLTGVLPPAFLPGSKLVLRTAPGPNNDRGWDWAFASSIVIARGDYQPEQFPGFNVMPLAVDNSSVVPLSDGRRLITMFSTPTGVTFALNGSETELKFTAGLLPGSYTQGETDGVAFVVELESPDTPAGRLYYRYLQPRTVATDRGDQIISIPLPPHAKGTRLHLRSDPGPANNGAWDWAYVSALTLH